MFQVLSNFFTQEFTAYGPRIACGSDIFAVAPSLSAISKTTVSSFLTIQMLKDKRKVPSTNGPLTAFPKRLG